MDPVSLFLLTIAAIFLIGIVGEVVFHRTGVPDVIWLIGVGIVLGPVTGFVARDQLMSIAPYFGALTLVVVLFDGGTELRLRELRDAAGRAALLALVTFSASVAAIASISMLVASAGGLPPTWTWLHAVALGSIVGGSSAVVVMPAVRSAGLPAQLANLLNLESALTDVLCVVCTVACVNVALSGEADPASAGIALGKSFGIGIGLGAAAGMLGLPFLRRLKRSQYAYPSMLGGLLALYVLTQELEGSAALAILTAAVIFGNAPQLSQIVGLAKTASLGRGVENAHDQVTFIVKSFFFTFIGAMLTPPWAQIGLGVMFGLLLLVARVPAVSAALVGSGLSRSAKGLIAVSMPRGMAAGVLAMVPTQAGMEGTETLPVIVFGAVLTSILIFTAGFPLLRGQLEVPASPVVLRDAGELADAAELADAVAASDAPEAESSGLVTVPDAPVPAKADPAAGDNRTDRPADDA